LGFDRITIVIDEYDGVLPMPSGGREFVLDPAEDVVKFLPDGNQREAEDEEEKYGSANVLNHGDPVIEESIKRYRLGSINVDAFSQSVEARPPVQNGRSATEHSVDSFDILTFCCNIPEG